MSSTDKDSKLTSASADDAVPYIVTDAPSPSTNITTAASPDASADNAKNKKDAGSKDINPFDHKDGDNEGNDGLEVHSPITSEATTQPVATATATPTTATTTTPPTIPSANAAPTEPATTPQEAERLAKLAILTEAFPTVEKEICEFVLESHRGDVEASINALLEMSDPEYRPEPVQQQQQQPPAQQQVPQHLLQQHQQAPPPLPQRSPTDPAAVDAAANEFARMRLAQQPRTEIDPLLLAQTSTPEQQLRADEDFARTLAAMDEYRVRRDQPHPQQQEEQGPSFAQEFKELMDEELPKIKERFNAAADTTKKKVNEWYEKFKASRAEAAAREAARREAANANNEAYYRDEYRRQGGYHDDQREYDREPIRFGGQRHDSDEPLARNRVTPPLPARRASPDDPASIPVESDTTTTTLLPGGRRTTTAEDVSDKDMGK